MLVSKGPKIVVTPGKADWELVIRTEWGVATGNFKTHQQAIEHLASIKIKFNPTDFFSAGETYMEAEAMFIGDKIAIWLTRR